MLNFFIILVSCTALHVLAMASAGWGAGVKIKEISVGMGPALWRHKIFVLKLLPLNGYVKFIEANELEEDDTDLPLAFDQQPAIQRILIILAGSAALMMLALVLQGEGALQDFMAFPAQYVMGALSPVELGPALLQDAYRLIQTASFTSLLGIVAAKLAALQLLPLVGSNGSMIIIILAQRWGLNKLVPDFFSKIFVLLSIACFFSWCLAIACTIKP